MKNLLHLLFVTYFVELEMPLSLEALNHLQSLFRPLLCLGTRFHTQLFNLLLPEPPSHLTKSRSLSFQ